MGRLNGKVCMVTGGTSGIGRAICQEFVKEGAAVAALAILDGNSQKTVDELNALGGRAFFVPMDVTSEEQWNSAKNAVKEKFGRIDVLVNCAGIFKEGKTTEVELGVFQKIMDVNVNGMFLGMKTCIPVMREQGGGSIINIASEAGIAAIPGQVAYNTSKAAAIMLTKSTAVDYALDHIRVNCICPGRVHTELVQRILDSAEDYDAQYKLMSEDRPMMHMYSQRKACRTELPKL
ncbi:MAG: SDR family NAD(P)-dependent oxidoreductase [Blautia sp.]|jgi:NAD(P)-dependent dehydrogenase (short-subunit alcohol dehydrogenase family)